MGGKPWFNLTHTSLSHSTPTSLRWTRSISRLHSHNMHSSMLFKLWSIVSLAALSLAEEPAGFELIARGLAPPPMELARTGAAWTTRPTSTSTSTKRVATTVTSSKPNSKPTAHALSNKSGKQRQPKVKPQTHKQTTPSIAPKFVAAAPSPKPKPVPQAAPPPPPPPPAPVYYAPAPEPTPEAPTSFFGRATYFYQAGMPGNSC